MLRWSLIASLLVHLLFLLISPLFIQMERPPGGFVPPVEGESRTTGIEMIEVVASENAPENPAEQDEPTTPPVANLPSPAPGAGPSTPTTGTVLPTPGQPAPPARDALQPGYRDPRLYVAPRPLPNVEQTEHERYMEHLQARIDAVNDSLAGNARRNATTSDWSATDGSGNRWGLSPEGLHLGGITIPRALLPLPGATGDNASLEEGRERQRQRDEIQRQEADRERARTQRERAEAIRQQEEQRRSGGN